MILKEDNVNAIFSDYYYFNFNYEEDTRPVIKINIQKTPNLNNKKDELILPSIVKTTKINDQDGLKKDLEKHEYNNIVNSFKGVKALKRNPSMVSTNTNSSSNNTLVSSNINHKKILSVNFENVLKNKVNINSIVSPLHNVKKSFSVYKLN